MEEWEIYVRILRRTMVIPDAMKKYTNCGTLGTGVGIHVNQKRKKRKTEECRRVRSGKLTININASRFLIICSFGSILPISISIPFVASGGSIPKFSKIAS